MPARRVTPADAPPTPVETRGDKLGLRFNRGRTLSSNSRLSLEAVEFAMEYGDPWAFSRRMFKAYFEELEDIGTLAEVVRIGAEAGLPADTLRAALEEGRYRGRVDEGITWSRKIGVTAIPTFLFNERLALVGAHELDAFRQIMDEIGAKKTNV